MLHNVAPPPYVVNFMVEKVCISDVAVPMPMDEVINVAQSF